MRMLLRTEVHTFSFSETKRADQNLTLINPSNLFTTLTGIPNGELLREQYVGRLPRTAKIKFNLLPPRPNKIAFFQPSSLFSTLYSIIQDEAGLNIGTQWDPPSVLKAKLPTHSICRPRST